MRQNDKREARVFARLSVAALIDVHLSTGDGDLFVGIEELTEEQQEEFVAEVGRIRDRVHPTRIGRTVPEADPTTRKTTP